MVEKYIKSLSKYKKWFAIYLAFWAFINILFYLIYSFIRWRWSIDLSNRDTRELLAQFEGITTGSIFFTYLVAIL